MQDFDDFNIQNFDVLVAKCGKSIGLKGEVKLIIYSDFLEIFTHGNIFKCGDSMLTLESFNPLKPSAKFKEITNIDSAKSLNSLLLYSSRELSDRYCKLSSSEFFWFDIVGLDIIEDDYLVGKVVEIERIGSVDYLNIEADLDFLSKNPHIKAKRFYLPYIERYILKTDLEAKCIFVKDSIAILEES